MIKILSMPHQQLLFMLVHVLRNKVLTTSRVQKKPTWGTCAGLILLSQEANATKKGGQALIGGISVRVHRNHFGRQIESFESPLSLPFLSSSSSTTTSSVSSSPANGNSGTTFPGIFIRAPVVEEVLGDGVEVLARLPGRLGKMKPANMSEAQTKDDAGDIIAVREGNVLGTSFHPELTSDARIHVWWLEQILQQKGLS
jgi:5'-phosphate synthase pdxT subunit